MTDENDELARKLHSDHCKLAWDAIRNSSDEYDKNLLKLSTAFLGLSLTFMKDIVPMNHLVHRYSLYWSWCLFALSVLAVVSSFQLSIKAHEKHLKHIDAYYLRGQKEALSAQNRWSRALDYTNWTAGLCFCAGLACSVYFVITNFWSNPK